MPATITWDGTNGAASLRDDNELIKTVKAKAV